MVYGRRLSVADGRVRPTVACSRTSYSPEFDKRRFLGRVFGLPPNHPKVRFTSLVSYAGSGRDVLGAEGPKIARPKARSAVLAVDGARCTEGARYTEGGQSGG